MNAASSTHMQGERLYLQMGLHYMINSNVSSTGPWKSYTLVIHLRSYSLVLRFDAHVLSTPIFTQLLFHSLLVFV